MSGWIGVDLDGTLAHYDNWVHHTEIGIPVPAMVERVQRWLDSGREVRIFTARVYHPGDDPRRELEAVESRVAIQAWCMKVFGAVLPVTCQKDYQMIELWDDRCVQVIPNTGMPVQ